MSTRLRDWAAVDYYEMLGVDAGASADEIARAFRGIAKRSHPDAAADPEASERFKELAAAYAVLSDGRTRRDYDRVRAQPQPGAPPPVRPAGAARRRPWSRRRCWWAITGGALIAVMGVGAAFATWHLHQRDASQRARFVPVTAQRIDGDANDIVFVTRDGRRIVTREPQQHGEGSGVDPTVGVRYDPADPQHVVVDAGTFGRDITLAIVALKLLIGGPVFVGVGMRRLKAVR